MISCNSLTQASVIKSGLCYITLSYFITLQTRIYVKESTETFVKCMWLYISNNIRNFHLFLSSDFKIDSQFDYYYLSCLLLNEKNVVTFCVLFIICSYLYKEHAPKIVLC